MHHPPFIILTILTYLSLNLTFTLASPTSTHPRNSCTTQRPSILQILSESNPTTTFPNLALQGGHFLVTSASTSTSTSSRNRTYQVLAFTNIPSGSWGCTLKLILPAPSPSSSIHTIGRPVLDIRVLNKGSSAGIQSPNTWSWANLDRNARSRSRRHAGGDAIHVEAELFGTLGFAGRDLEVGGLATVVRTINSQACPTDLNGGGNLGFVFSVAEWVEGEAVVYFNSLMADGLMGVYLTYNC